MVQKKILPSSPIGAQDSYVPLSDYKYINKK